MKKIAYNHPMWNKAKTQADHFLNRDYNFIQVDVVRDHFMSNSHGEVKMELSEQIACPSFKVLWEDQDAISERDAFDEYWDSGAYTYFDRSEIAEEWWDSLSEDTRDQNYFPEKDDEGNVDYDDLLNQWEQVIKQHFTDNYEPDDEFYDWAEEEYHDQVMDWYHESEHYPMWNTLFEARDGFESRWIDNHVDLLYELGIGVISGHGHLNSMLFLSSAGHDFYEAYWVPMYLAKGWIKLEEEGIDEAAD